MEGELYARDGTIDRFAIATTDYRKVFDLFREGTVEGRPMTWRFLGAISITYKEGGTITVWLFATYHGPGAYKIAETYYRGSTDGVFVQTLRECEERSKAAKKR